MTQAATHSTLLQPSPHTAFFGHLAQNSQAPTQATTLPGINNNTHQRTESSQLYLDSYDDIDFTSTVDETVMTANPCASCTILTAMASGDADDVIPTDVILHNAPTGFLGFCLDSGAASSVSGEQQFKHFMSITTQTVEVINCNTKFRFGKTIAHTAHRFKLRIPLSHSTHIEVQVAVVPLDIPFLLGLEMLVHYGLELNFFKMHLRYQDTDFTVPILIYDKHAYVHSRQHRGNLTRTDTTMVLYNKHELRKLHLQFYHPRPTQLFNLIKHAKPSQATSETRELLKQVTDECEQCQSFHSGPMRFRVALPEESITFNADVAFDFVWLDGRPVLHVVDLQTRFQNAVFMHSKSTEAVWNAFIEIWCSTYTGFPSTLHLDQESSFTSADMASNFESQGITLSVSGIESHNSIGAGESYHRQLRRVYNCVRSQHPEVEPQHALRLAIKGVNDTAGVNGLVPTTLVFGTIPSFPATPSNQPKQRERFAAMMTARNEMTQIISEKRLNDGLRRKLPSSTAYLIRPGDLVRVYREASKAWDGPFTTTKVDRKLITVTDGIKTKTFNVAQVLPVKTVVRDPATQRQLDRIFDHAIFSTEVLKSTDPRFNCESAHQAIRDEVNGLEQRGVFTPVSLSDIPKDATILGMKLIMGIKDGSTPTERYKARIVALGHRDRQKALLIHVAVPVRTRSVRIGLCLAVSLDW